MQKLRMRAAVFDAEETRRQRKCRSARSAHGPAGAESKRNTATATAQVHKPSLCAFGRGGDRRLSTTASLARKRGGVHSRRHWDRNRCRASSPAWWRRGLRHSRSLLFPSCRRRGIPRYSRRCADRSGRASPTLGGDAAAGLIGLRAGQHAESDLAGTQGVDALGGEMSGIPAERSMRPRPDSAARYPRHARRIRTR